MLNISEFINKYAEINEITKKQSKEEIERFVSTFNILTFEGGSDLRGFIKSEVVNVPAKKCRNPKDGSIVDVPAKKVVKIKVSSKFKNLEEE